MADWCAGSRAARRPARKTGGEGGIRTLGPPQGGQRFSRPPRSTAPAPLHPNGGEGLPRAAREHQANEGQAGAGLLRRGKNEDNPAQGETSPRRAGAARVSATGEERAMNDLSPVVRPLSTTAQPISPTKFAHFVLRTGQIDRM